MKLLKRLIRDDEGVTMIEYVLIAALIAIAAIVATGLAGDAVSATFEYIKDELFEIEGING